MAQLKILLCAVNTKYIHSNPAVYLLKAFAQKQINSLCAARENPGSEKPFIEVDEFTINNRGEDVLAAIYEKKPDAVFFSCYIWNMEFISALLDDLGRILPDTDIWLGGPEVSFDPEQQLELHRNVKGILTGEGEETFSQLIADCYFLHGKDLTQIKGLCFRDHDRIIFTGKRELMSMDDVPFIYEDGGMGVFNNKIIYYESSRGCPFSCSYCLSSTDRTVRFRSLPKVFEELEFFLRNRIPQVKFVDRTFNIDHSRSAKILQFLKEHDNGVTNFHFEIAGELLSEEELEIMSGMRPGLIQLEIGVQSVNPATLSAINRNADLKKLRDVVERIRYMGNIHIHLDLIAGLPYEDYDSFAHSFNEVYAMKPAQLQLGFLKVLKGSPMQEQASRYGIIYRKRAPYEVLSTGWISFDRILSLKQTEEMVELYYNSAQFTRTIAVLETFFDTPFELYEKLGRYYKENGYFISSPSRLYRYQVLLDFIVRFIPEMKDIFRELLTFDLYLREDLKSRPAFAPDQTPVREILKSAAARVGKGIHVEAFHYPVHREDPSIITDTADKSLYILAFDYGKRNPLDHNASVRVLELLKF